MIKAVVFDLDDTLFPERDYVISGFSVVANQISNDYGINTNKVFNCLWTEFKSDTANVFNRVLKILELPFDEYYILKLIKIYREHKPKINLYKDAVYILEFLNAKGIQVGLITDGYEITQKNKLDALNIKKYFNYIVITDQLGREYWKPHKLSYELAMQNLKVNYNEMVYVGDNLQKDFISPNKLGITSILIKRDDGIYSKIQAQEENMAKYEVNNLYELEKILVF